MRAELAAVSPLHKAVLGKNDFWFGVFSVCEHLIHFTCETLQTTRIKIDVKLL